MEEKLRWAFSLYDINGDGYITREEMTDIVSSVYDLMGKLAEPCIDDDTIKEKVDRIFQVKCLRSSKIFNPNTCLCYTRRTKVIECKHNVFFITDGKMTRQERKLLYP